MNTQRNDNIKARLTGILRPIYDAAKIRTKETSRVIGKQLSIAGPPIFAWLMKHKASVAIVLLVLYILFIPRRSPDRKVTDAQPLAITTAPPSATPPTTEATTVPSAPESDSVIPLYSPDRPGFEPQWGLPAELKAADLQDFARQVEKLADDTQQTMTLEGQDNKLLTYLIDDKMTVLYWQRLLGRGFHDTSLPLDWYEVVKDRNGLFAATVAMTELMAHGNAEMVTMARLTTVRVRVIGGKVIVGDELFVKALQRYISQRLSYLQAAVPKAQDVATRTAKEFQLDSSFQIQVP